VEAAQKGWTGIGGFGAGMQSRSVTYHVHLHHCIGVLPRGVERNRERESRLAAQPRMGTNTHWHAHTLKVTDSSSGMKELNASDE